MTSKVDLTGDSFAHLCAAAAALGLDPTSHGVMEWLIEVDVSETEEEVSPHVEPPASIGFQAAKAACERALSIWMRQPMSTREIRAHNGIYGGADAHDESSTREGWKRDQRICELADRGQTAAVIGERMGISADAVRKAIKRHRLLGDARQEELTAASPDQQEMRARLLQRLRTKRPE